MQIIINILAFIAAVGVLVSVHEFGHFIVARWAGIKVLRFSIGFGRPLLIWHRRGDETEYVIAALPLGGYVKMLDEREGEVSEPDRPRAFNRQPLHKRLAVVLAGPAFNLLFAVLAYWAIFMAGIPGIKTLVGEVPAGTPAAVAGIAPQDEILTVAGHETRTWDAAQLALFQAVMHGGLVAVTVRSASGQERAVSLVPVDNRALTEPGKLLPGLGLSPWDPPIPPVIGELTPQGTGKASGLLVGDRVLSADGQAVESWQKLKPLLEKSPGKTLALILERGGRNIPLALKVGMEKTAAGVVGRIGARPQIPPGLYDGLRAEQRYNPPAALGQAFRRTAELAWLTLDSAWNMLLGNVSWRNLSGPIDIAQYAGYTAESGLVPFLAFLAIVSISLGVLNLLPVPVLDGGHVLYFAVELVKGSPLSQKAELMGQRVGIALLMVLMGFAIYNDLMRIFS
ncbi:MAG TPA: RIP metalloprotease RseP [Gammaproteobacteria bacterium]|nr:RIP metalloprotease RseP [Gammaproteobacteria bacterium]